MVWEGEETTRTHARFHAVVNLYGSESGFSERTNHSPRLRRLNGRLQFLGGAHQALVVVRNPVGCVNVGPESALKGQFRYFEQGANFSQSCP